MVEVPDARTDNLEAPWHCLLGAKDICALANISRAHLYNLTREGHFPVPGLRMGPRFTRWKGEDVRAWLRDPTGWIAANGEVKRAEDAAG